MFIHRNRGRNAQAVSLGLLAAALISTVVSAADTPGPLRAGRLQQPRRRHADHARRVPDRNTGRDRASVQADPGALATNHCVAFAMSEQHAQAQLACDAAVRDAHGEQAQLPSWNPRSHAVAANAEAIAYSNRAVLRWLNADTQGARQDLAGRRRWRRRRPSSYAT